MAKDILKEAIADAKAVREVALANAKAALEEAFTPKLQSMLSAKLSEELDEDMYDEDDMDEGHGEMHDEDMDEDMDEDLDEEIDLEEILNELELEEGDDEQVEEGAVGYPNYRADQIMKVKQDADDINRGLNENEEFDLDSLLKEINDLEEEKETNEEELDEISGYDQMFRKKKARNMKMEETNGCTCNESKALADSLSKELNETKTALKTVRGELNEVNLLNSKLLYVNRIFKANNLSESQKLRVVETLDNASNIKEAKLIYETIKDTFTISKGKKTAPKKSIRENFGMASKAAGISTAPKREVISESTDMVARFKKLANIKINE